MYRKKKTEGKIGFICTYLHPSAPICATFTKPLQSPYMIITWVPFKESTIFLILSILQILHALKAQNIIVQRIALDVKCAYIQFALKGPYINIEISDSEIMTILLLFHYGTFKNFKHYYLHYIGIHLKEYFPKQLSYNRFVAVVHRVFVPMMFFLNMVCCGKCTGITFINSTKISVCHNKRIRRNKVFSGIAKTGKTSMGWFYGFKFHLLCNDKLCFS